MALRVSPSLPITTDRARVPSFANSKRDVAKALKKRAGMEAHVSSLDQRKNAAELSSHPARIRMMSPFAGPAALRHDGEATAGRAPIHNRRLAFSFHSVVGTLLIRTAASGIGTTHHGRRVS